MKLRHGDVILEKTDVQPVSDSQPNLVLAEGEVTGHAHRITAGTALLYGSHEEDNMMLVVESETAHLTHEEHKAIEVPQGTWRVTIQREYQPEGWHYIQD